MRGLKYGEIFGLGRTYQTFQARIAPTPILKTLKAVD